MSINTAQYPKFKSVRSAFILFLFQTVSDIVISTSIYLLVDILKLLPASLEDKHVLCTLSTYLGGMIYGAWIENKYPGLLTKDKIKKVTLYNTVINSIFITVILYLWVGSDLINDKGLDLINVGFFMLAILLVMSISYFITLSCVARGVEIYSRKNV